jgi:hypothetical protein
MAQTTVQVLLPSSSHTEATGTVMSIIGSAKQAAAYYIANANMQTISWSLQSQFVGTVEIQATLDASESTTNWSTLYTVDTVNQKTGFYNLTGHYVWLRAKVSNWTEGTINSIYASY